MLTVVLDVRRSPSAADSLAYLNHPSHIELIASEKAEPVARSKTVCFLALAHPVGGSQAAPY